MIKIERNGPDEFTVKADTRGIADLMMGITALAIQRDHVEEVARFAYQDVPAEAQVQIDAELAAMGPAFIEEHERIQRGDN